MLQEFLSQLCAELDILPVPTLDERRTAVFALRPDAQAEVQDLKPGFALRSMIGPCPTQRREELFMQLMRANYLGQLTGACRIGLSTDEKSLTLSLAMPYEMGYRHFREAMEDFFNFLLYWREEMAKFEQQKALL